MDISLDHQPVAIAPQRATTDGIDLDGYRGFKTSRFKTEIQPPDTCK